MDYNNIGKPHAIVFPYPYQGHITPMINLVTNLASRGFTITFVQLEHMHHTISKARDDATDDLFVEARNTGLDIRYVTISDGFSLDFKRDDDDASFREYWESMTNDFPKRVDELVQRIISESGDDNGAFFLIADSTFSWPATIALKHKLVNVALSPGSALTYLLGYYFHLALEKGHLSYEGGDCTVVDYIPGVESLSTKDLMCIQLGDATPTMAKIYTNATEQVKNADFVVFNTVQELESNYLSAINQKQPAYAIGPVEFFNCSKTTAPLWAQSDCTHWLDSKPPASVLYVSFGSIAELSKYEIEQLAHGLVLSQVNFIWIMRTSTDVFHAVGFEDAARERGLVVPWCNQNEVLAHPAVGGFVTHCGWNSIVESMWNGVPMICYPFYVDQPTNRKLVVDLKIGVNLVDHEGATVTKEEVVRKIDILIRGIVLREEAKKVSKIMRNALHHDGSSRRNFDKFVHDLKARLESRSNNTT